MDDSLCAGGCSFIDIARETVWTRHLEVLECVTVQFVREPAVAVPSHKKSFCELGIASHLRALIAVDRSEELRRGAFNSEVVSWMATLLHQTVKRAINSTMCDEQM